MCVSPQAKGATDGCSDEAASLRQKNSVGIHHEDALSLTVDRPLASDLPPERFGLF